MPTDARQPHLRFRCITSLHQKLHAAAKENGCTVTDEIERRLERTFIEDRERAAQSAPPSDTRMIEINIGPGSFIPSRPNWSLVTFDDIHPDGF